MCILFLFLFGRVWIFLTLQIAANQVPMSSVFFGPPLSPRVCSDSRPLSRRCCLTISSSAVHSSSFAFSVSQHWGGISIVKVKVSQSCPILCDPMDYTVYRILPARTLEWVAMVFSRGSSQPRDRTQVSHIAAGFFTSWAIKDVHSQRYFWRSDFYTEHCCPLKFSEFSVGIFCVTLLHQEPSNSFACIVPHCTLDFIYTWAE